MWKRLIAGLCLCLLAFPVVAQMQGFGFRGTFSDCSLTTSATTNTPSLLITQTPSRVKVMIWNTSLASTVLGIAFNTATPTIGGVNTMLLNAGTSTTPPGMWTSTDDFVPLNNIYVVSSVPSTKVGCAYANQ